MTEPVQSHVEQLAEAAGRMAAEAAALHRAVGELAGRLPGAEALPPRATLSSGPRPKRDYSFRDAMATIQRAEAYLGASAADLRAIREHLERGG